MTVSTHVNNAARKAFGQWLRERREAKEISQADLAKEIGSLYGTFIAQYEDGLARIASDAIVPYAGAIGVSPAALTRKMLKAFDPHLYAALFGDDEEPATNMVARMAVRIIFIKTELEGEFVDYVVFARRILEAMRKISDDMITAGVAELCRHDTLDEPARVVVTAIWQAMIDTALESEDAT